MAATRSSLYARRMTNRETIERLRKEVGVDYAFGITGLLTLADAVDDLIERVNALEQRTDETATHRHPRHHCPHRFARKGE